MTPHHFMSILSRPARLLALSWFFGGASLVLGVALGFEANPALGMTHPFVKMFLGFLLMIGSAGVSFSTVHWRNKTTSIRLEVFSLPVLIAAWALYTIAILLIDGFPLFPIAIGLGSFAACALRLIEILATARQTRRNVDNLETLGEGE